MAGDGGMVPAGLTKVLVASPRGMYRPNRSSERVSMWCELQAKGGGGKFNNREICSLRFIHLKNYLKMDKLYDPLSDEVEC